MFVFIFLFLKQAQQLQTSTSISHMRGSMRRGRGRSNGVHRREFSTRQTFNNQEIQQVLDQSQQPPQHMQQQMQQQMTSSQIQQNQPHPQQGQPHQQQLIQPNFAAYPGYQYGYYAQPGPMQVGFPTAQHATGTPLYANHHVQMYVPAPPYYQYHPGMIYPHMVPAEYSGIIENNKEDGSPEPVGQVQPMWHPAPMAWHPNMTQPISHTEDYLSADDIDEYNNYQPHPMDHQSPQVLSPIYNKDEHGFHGIHPHHQEFIAVNQHIAHLSPQPHATDPNQHHPHHTHHQQPHMQIQQQQQPHHQQHPHHHSVSQPHMVPIPQLVMHTNDNNLVINEFIGEENASAESNSVMVENVANLGETSQHAGSESQQNLNNNYEFDKYRLENPSLTDENSSQSLQQPILIVNADVPIVPAESSIIYVPNILQTAASPVNPTLPISTAVQPNDVSPNAKKNNNNNVTSKMTHQNPFAQSHPNSHANVSNVSANAMGTASIMSTDELDKLAKSTSDKLIIKHDRPTEYNHKITHNNMHNQNHKSSNSAWNYNKKNTVNVSVSAVPMHNPPNVLLPTPKQPLIAHTPPHRSDYGNRSQSPSVPKPFVPKQQHHHHPSDDYHHNTKYCEFPNQSIHLPVAVANKPAVATTSIASTAVPKKMQPELRTKQVEIVPNLLTNQTPTVQNADLIVVPVADEKHINPVSQPVEEVVLVTSKPPSTSQTSKPSSWASLFAGEQTDRTPHIEQVTTKKPVAKVLPFDSNTTNVNATTQSVVTKPTVHTATTSTTPIQTAADEATPIVSKPMSYSAASSQGLPGANPLNQNAKKQISKATVVPSKPIVVNDDTSSLKLGGKLSNSSISAF